MRCWQPRRRKRPARRESSGKCTMCCSAIKDILRAPTCNTTRANWGGHGALCGRNGRSHLPAESPRAHRRRPPQPHSGHTYFLHQRRGAGHFLRNESLARCSGSRGRAASQIRQQIKRAPLRGAPEWGINGACSLASRAVNSNRRHRHRRRLQNRHRRPRRSQDHLRRSRRRPCRCCWIRALRPRPRV
jgi:hypothetical protein